MIDQINYRSLKGGSDGTNFTKFCFIEELSISMEVHVKVESNFMTYHQRRYKREQNNRNNQNTATTMIV